MCQLLFGPLLIILGVIFTWGKGCWRVVMSDFHDIEFIMKGVDWVYHQQEPIGLVMIGIGLFMVIFMGTPKAGNGQKPILQVAGFSYTINDLCRGILVTGKTGSGKTASAIMWILHSLFGKVHNGPGGNGMKPWGGLALDEKGNFFSIIQKVAQHHKQDHRLIVLQVRPEGEPDWKPKYMYNLLSDDTIPGSSYAKNLVDMASAVNGGEDKSGYFKPTSMTLIASAIEYLRGVKGFIDLLMEDPKIYQQFQEIVQPGMSIKVKDAAAKEVEIDYGKVWAKTPKFPSISNVHDLLTDLNNLAAILPAVGTLSDEFLGSFIARTKEYLDKNNPSLQLSFELQKEKKDLEEAKAKTSVSAAREVKIRAYLQELAKLEAQQVIEKDAGKASALYQKITALRGNWEKENVPQLQLVAVQELMKFEPRFEAALEAKRKELLKNGAGSQDEAMAEYSRNGALLKRATEIQENLRTQRELLEGNKYLGLRPKGGGDSQQLNGLVGTIATYLGPFNEPDLKEVFCAQENTFNFPCIDDGIIFSVSMPQKYSMARKYVNTLFKLQYYQHALRRFDDSGKIQRGENNFLLLIADEAQGLITTSKDGLNDYQTIDKTREASATVLFATQSSTSLKGAGLGKEQCDTLLLNLANQFIYQVADDDHAELVAKSIGKVEKEKRSRSESPRDTSYSYQKEDQYRIKPQDLRAFKKFECVVQHADGEARRLQLPPLGSDGQVPGWFFTDPNCLFFTRIFASLYNFCKLNWMTGRKI